MSGQYAAYHSTSPIPMSTKYLKTFILDTLGTTVSADIPVIPEITAYTIKGTVDCSVNDPPSKYTITSPISLGNAGRDISKTCSIQITPVLGSYSCWRDGWVLQGQSFSATITCLLTEGNLHIDVKVPDEYNQHHSRDCAKCIADGRVPQTVGGYIRLNSISGKLVISGDLS